MANLDIALKKVLLWEGGYSNNVHDGGGSTYRGVTLYTYKAYCKAKGLPTPTNSDLVKIDYTVIRDLADVLFWTKMRGNEINSQSIANLCFDCVWGSGMSYVKVIQDVLGVKADGIIGRNTIAAINGYIPQKELFELLWQRRKTYLENCKNAKYFLNGWMRRLNDYKFEL